MLESIVKDVSTDSFTDRISFSLSSMNSLYMDSTDSSVFQEGCRYMVRCVEEAVNPCFSQRRDGRSEKLFALTREDGSVVSIVWSKRCGELGTAICSGL